jgi:molybdate transport system substrate-binding protein
MIHGLFFWLAVLILGLPTAAAETLTVAVASNFSRPAQELASRYEKATGQSVRITTGSTGKLYAQISNGAPFDILLAADSARPVLLEESGLGVAGSRFTYAIGGLTLWSLDTEFADLDCRAALNDLGKNRLAIANPETAPYGAAAKQFLLSAQLWDKVAPHLVYGENIAQTLQFVASGNASLGLIAQSQASDGRLPEATCQWPVPEASHSALEQQAILLRRAEDLTIAADFLGFLRGPVAHDVIRSHGYSVAE